MTTSTDLAISNNMSSFVPKYWLNWQILVAIFNEFVDKDGTTKLHTCPPLDLPSVIQCVSENLL